MEKWLIKSTNELRLETKAEVDLFRDQMQKEAANLECHLSSWQETLKEIKAKGEVVDQFYLVKYTLTFSDPKEPITPLNFIEYHIGFDE